MLNTIVEQNKVSGKVKFSPFRSSVYKENLNFSHLNIIITFLKDKNLFRKFALTIEHKL